MSKDIPVFNKEQSPNFKYESRYAVELFRHIMNGGAFDSFLCGDKDHDGKPNGKAPITKKTLYNWYNSIPEFAHARELAESRVQANIDKTIYSGAMGVIQKKVIDPVSGVVLVDPDQANPKLLMFLAKTRFKKTYSEKNEVTLSNADGSNIGAPMDLSKLTDDELDAYIKLTGKLSASTANT